MEIRKRIGHPRGYFHVMNRGARKVTIFADETDRTIFRGLLGRYARKHNVKILAWCLMPNHYHLQPDTEGTPLSHMMRDLDATYARSFNARHRTSGRLFQGPYKSILIQDLDGLAYVNRYIHLNPVDLGQSPGAYRWSSCSTYLGVSAAPAWMDLEPVMRALRNPERSDAESYAYYLREGLARRKRKSRKKMDEVGAFYSEWILHLQEKCIETFIGREDLLGRISLNTLVAWLAHRVQGVPADAVAAFFGSGSPGTIRNICARVQRRIEEDPALSEAIERANISPTVKRWQFALCYAERVKRRVGWCTGSAGRGAATTRLRPDSLAL